MIDDSFPEWGGKKINSKMGGGSWGLGFKGALDYLWLVMGMHDSYKQHEHLRFLFFHPNLNPQGDFLLWSLSSR
jgi:hypothetical protein